MRGRKPICISTSSINWRIIKKESPNEGTETRIISVSFDDVFQHIKKESPNEGTETRTAESCKLLRLRGIKKESPNEGAEKTMME